MQLVHSGAAVLTLLTLVTPRSSVSQTPTPTRVMVRVTAHDAKIIGSAVGGALVTIVDVETRDTLASGVQSGKTGDTRRIMVEPHQRGSTVYDTPGAAGFLAELSLARPTVVEIFAAGPLGTPHAIQRATKTMLLVPGQDVVGEGVIIELVGHTVTLEVPDHVRAGSSFEIRANVTMLCGCPTEPGGLWDANEISVVTSVIRDGRATREFPLEFAGVTSTYRGSTSIDHPGDIIVEVLAMNPRTGNFGSARATVRVDR